MELENIKLICVDCETDGLNPAKDKLVLIGYRIDEGPYKHIWFDDTSKYSANVKELSSLLSNPLVLKRAHNAKFDYLFLVYNGFNVVGPFDDTRIVAYCENPFQNIGLKDLVRNRLNRPVVEFKELQRTNG